MSFAVVERNGHWTQITVRDPLADQPVGGWIYRDGSERADADEGHSPP